MTRTMLVPFDGSEGARAALGHAGALATDERLLALRVVEPVPGGTGESAEGDDRVRDRFERAFEDALARLEEAHDLGDDAATLDAAFHYGHPLHELLLAIDRYVAEEVVMGAHGRDGAGELGSLAESIARRSPAPVTVVRPGWTDDGGLPGSVLVPFDGSEPARDALRYAIDRFPDADVVALYADYPATGDAEHLGPGGDRSTGFGGWYEAVREWHALADRDPDSVLGIAEEVAAESGHELRTAVEPGEPTRVILEHVTGSGFDHVVVGSHGHAHDGVARQLLGSVAATVVRRSPTSVTVVR